MRPKHSWGTVRAVCGPGVRAVVARKAGRPVAAAMVVASGTVAGIQLVGTVPAARARLRGAVHALGGRSGIRAGSRRHRPRGVGGAGEPLYLRLGFVEVSRAPLALRPAPDVDSEEEPWVTKHR